MVYFSFLSCFFFRIYFFLFIHIHIYLIKRKEKEEVRTCFRSSKKKRGNFLFFGRRRRRQRLRLLAVGAAVVRLNLAGFWAMSKEKEEFFFLKQVKNESFCQKIDFYTPKMTSFWDWPQMFKTASFYP
ncbi:hypothetical protein V6Z12_A04G002800 [Gossypium hirsutum]